LTEVSDLKTKNQQLKDELKKQLEEKKQALQKISRLKIKIKNLKDQLQEQTKKNEETAIQPVGPSYASFGFLQSSLSNLSTASITTGALSVLGMGGTGYMIYQSIRNPEIARQRIAKGVSFLASTAALAGSVYLWNQARQIEGRVSNLLMQNNQILAEDTPRSSR
jgi:DNA repair exonuclease SbcCD ATPase subunit